MLELLDRAVEFLGDAAERVASFDGVVGDAVDAVGTADGSHFRHVDLRTAVIDEAVRFVGIDGLLKVDEHARFLGGQTERIGGSARKDVPRVLRVEAAQFVHGDVQILADLLEVHALGGADGVGQHRFLNGRLADAVLFTVVHGVVGGNEDRHVVACLAGQVGIDGPEIAFAAGTADGFVDITAAAVIGSDDEVPIMIDGVHAAQETARGVGRFDGVHTFVHQRVDLQSEQLAGGGHELPQSGGTHVRAGDGIEGGLDDRQVLQFVRQVVSCQGFFEDREVVLAHAHHACYLFGAALDVSHNEGAHTFVVR